MVAKACGDNLQMMFVSQTCTADNSDGNGISCCHGAINQNGLCMHSKKTSIAWQPSRSVHRYSRHDAALQLVAVAMAMSASVESFTYLSLYLHASDPAYIHRLQALLI